MAYHLGYTQFLDTSYPILFGTYHELIFRQAFLDRLAHQYADLQYTTSPTADYEDGIGLSALNYQQVFDIKEVFAFVKSSDFKQGS